MWKWFKLTQWGKEWQCTTDFGVWQQGKDSAFCVIDETPDNTDEEALVNQDQQETHSGNF